LIAIRELAALFTVKNCEKVQLRRRNQLRRIRRNNLMTTASKAEVETAESPSPEICWELLERVAASSHLRRATRLQELLLYLGKRSLRDGCDRLQEHEIGSSVFHRPQSYDTSFDNIVRTSVSDLRRRIEAYFNTEGLAEPLVMEIPRGSYIPIFRARTPKARIALEAPDRPHPADQKAADAQPAEPSRRDRVSRAAVLSASLLAIALVVLCVFLWVQNRTLRYSIYGWQQEPTVESLWSGVLNASPDTDVVISDTAIGVVQALSHEQFTLNEYLTRSYVNRLNNAGLSPDLRAALDRILSWNLANPGEFALARRILALDPGGKRIHLYNARDYMPDLIKRDNVILIGARKSNPWDELFDDRLNFITEFDSPRVINRAPQRGEQQTYISSDSTGYCVVSYMPKPDRSGIVLLVEGTNAEATEAAGDFLLSEDELAGFKRMLHVSTLPYFQVLLKVSSVRGTPLAATVEAYRTYPGIH
jgi:hypothetical protein